MAQVLTLADDLFDALLDGRKRVTVRSGRRDVFPGPLRFRSASGRLPEVTVQVTEVRWKRLVSLTDEEARLDGAADAVELREVLRRFYPDLQDGDWITVVLYHPPAPG